MNLSNKNEALENVAKAILEGNTIEIEETLQEVNGDAYRWEDINNALMQAGFGPKVIIKVLMKLKGKKIKEGVEIDEAKLKGTVKTQAAKMFEGLANDVEYLKDAMNHSTYKDAIKDWEANADGKDLIKAIGKILQTQYFGK